MKNTFDRFISRLDTAEERISEPEDTSVETCKTKKQMEQRLKKKSRTEYSRTVKQLWKV